MIDRVLDLRMPSLHALNHCGLLLGGQILEVEVLAGANAQAGQLRADRRFFRCSRGKLHHNAHIFEEIGLHQVLVDLRQVDRRRGRRRRLLEISR
ncbi:hypothetical protein D3C76_1171010 [compost metagenome]